MKREGSGLIISVIVWAGHICLIAHVEYLGDIETRCCHGRKTFKCDKQRGSVLGTRQRDSPQPDDDSDVAPAAAGAHAGAVAFAAGKKLMCPIYTAALSEEAVASDGSR